MIYKNKIINSLCQILVSFGMCYPYSLFKTTVFMTTLFLWVSSFQMLESLKSQSGSASWDESEAALFVMCAVAKNVVP